MSGAATAVDPDHGAVSFEVGDRVVHPRHGAGVLVSCERRLLLGSERDYLEIKLDNHALRIMLPCESAEAVGLRRVAVLEDEPNPFLPTWQARQKHYREKLKDGDILELAALVRDLAMRDAESGLPAMERELYKRSRGILVSELRYALDVDPERASAYIDEHLGCEQLSAG